MTAPAGGRRARRRRYRTGDTVHDDRGEALELREEIGGGGQGTVWSLAGGQVAAKILKPEAGIGADELRTRLAAVRRFELTGIPIARPLTLLVGDEVGYTMELLAGMTAIGSLAAVPYEGTAAWFQGTGGLRRRLRLLALAAEALDRLHARGLAYGDVSPGNILVSTRSEHDQVWLIDPDNVSVRARPSDAAHVTPGYAAPELITGRAGQDSLTDAFAFAVLAFHVLALVHPFQGDAVDRDPGLEPAAFRGEWPWIDHPEDHRNRSSQGLGRDLVLTGGLRRLAALAFEDGLRRPERRPSLREWHDKLDQAALLMVACPACGGTYHAQLSQCPWCRGCARPSVLRCDVHGFLPAGAVPGTPDETETDRLRSMILPMRQAQVVRARTGLLCLDRGPSEIPVDPGEPLVELAWSGAPRLTVQRVGRHDAWMVDRSARRSVRLGAGETWPLDLDDAGRWTLHFGVRDEAHRFMRFLMPKRGV
ncbi:protein kinase domain-containing protein [Actinomadura litoris]|uniref:protein kinase domain-containing protein n=1 Tax=Actinomadura litoris TaxID=2678616 RepID=UPI001FA79BDD|nr:lipopolysaccharide kinase InaA family protein [Actinomadura litoris]